MKVHVVDLKSETIATPISVRAYLNQTITEFKQLIAQVSYLTQVSSSLHLLVLQLFYFKHQQKDYVHQPLV